MKIIILIGTFLTVAIPAIAITQYLKMKSWFEVGTLWALGVTLIVAGIIL